MTQTTENERVLLRVRRFQQLGEDCALAAASSVANYYDPLVSYTDLMSKDKDDTGVYVPEVARLLNKLGFTKVTIVTCDLEMFDYSWNRFTNKGFVSRLKRARRYFNSQGWVNYIPTVDSYVKLLSDSTCDNKVIVDHDASPYIKRHLKNGTPVIGVVNCNALYKCAKGTIAKNKDIKGDTHYHTIVVCGYDKEYVFVVDSNDCKKKNGRYKIKWSKFLTIVNEIILVG